MKKFVIIIFSAIAVFWVTSLILHMLVSEAANDISVSDIDFANIPDGTYILCRL